MSSSKVTLGERLRQRRLELGIGLRELASKVGISPTFLSRVETNDEKSPPAEKNLRALAEQLQLDADELLTLAGRVSSDVVEMLIRDPGLLAFLRTASAEGFGSTKLRELFQSWKAAQDARPA